MCRKHQLPPFQPTVPPEMKDIRVVERLCRPRWLAYITSIITTIAKTLFKFSADNDICAALPCTVPSACQGGCALSTQGTTKYGGEAEGINMITFKNKAKFKDNVCDVSVSCHSCLVRGFSLRGDNICVPAALGCTSYSICHCDGWCAGGPLEPSIYHTTVILIPVSLATLHETQRYHGSLFECIPVATTVKPLNLMPQSSPCGGPTCAAHNPPQGPSDYSSIYNVKLPDRGGHSIPPG